MESVSDTFVVETDKVVSIFAGEIESSQEFHQQCNGIETLLRLGTVSRYSLYSDFKAFAYAFGAASAYAIFNAFPSVYGRGFGASGAEVAIFP